MNERRRIVVLGGGFGGLMTIRNLIKQNSKNEIVLVDHGDAHIYTPWLYEIATGLLLEKKSARFSVLKKTAGILFKNFITLHKTKNVRFRKASVTGCDFESKHILLEGDKTLSYDTLVIALGSQSAFFDIPGLKQNAFTIRTPEEAVRIQSHLHKLLNELSTGHREQIKIVVGGAGATGTEFASELANFVNGCCKQRLIDRGKVRILLVELGSSVLGQSHEGMQRIARKRLEDLGVELCLETKISRVSASKITVCGVLLPTGKTQSVFKEETDITSDMLVWTGGIETNSVVASLKLPKDARGRLLVDEHLNVQGTKDIFALGDCASFVHPDTKRPLPPLAQVAIKQSKLLARNIIAKSIGKKMYTMSFPKNWKTVVPIGGRHAVIHVFGVTLDGRLAYFIRQIADLRYFFFLMPWRYAIKAWRSAERLFALND